MYHKEHINENVQSNNKGNAFRGNMEIGKRGNGNTEEKNESCKDINNKQNLYIEGLESKAHSYLKNKQFEKAKGYFETMITIYMENGNKEKAFHVILQKLKLGLLSKDYDYCAMWYTKGIQLLQSGNTLISKNHILRLYRYAAQTYFHLSNYNICAKLCNQILQVDSDDNVASKLISMMNR